MGSIYAVALFAMVALHCASGGVAEARKVFPGGQLLREQEQAMDVNVNDAIDHELNEGVGGYNHGDEHYDDHDMYDRHHSSDYDGQGLTPSSYSRFTSAL